MVSPKAAAGKLKSARMEEREMFWLINSVMEIIRSTCCIRFRVRVRIRVVHVLFVILLFLIMFKKVFNIIYLFINTREGKPRA